MMKPKAWRGGERGARGRLLASAFFICSDLGMSQRVVTHLEHLVTHQGIVIVECPRCGHGSQVRAQALLQHCTRRNLSTEWRDVVRLFRCADCGQRPCKAYFSPGPTVK